MTSPTAPTSRCAVELAASPSTVDAAGGSGQITISTNRDCTWSARAENDWITLAAPASGQGEGSVRFTMSANAAVTSRRGGVAVNDQRIEITQSAAACRFQLSAPGGSVGSEGGTLTVGVSAQASCAWSAETDASWVAIESGRQGSGDGTVALSVQPNSGAARTATIRIAGQEYVVTQPAPAMPAPPPPAPGCQFSVSPQTESFTEAGGEGTLAIVASSSACAWAALSNTPWIAMITTGGNGSGSARYVVATNTGGARTGTLAAAGATIRVTQAAAAPAPCQFGVSPQSASVPSGGGDGSVQVTTTSGCAWTAASNVPWISIASGGGGSGNGTVRYNAAPNTGAERTGSLTVAGATVTVTQAAAPAPPACDFTVSPQTESFGVSGGSGSVRVTATSSSCSWSASSGAPWIVVTTGSGTGNGNAQYTVAANTGPARTGTLTVAGAAVTISQAGCSVTVSPLSASYTELGGAGSVRIDANASSCAWTAASAVSWITLTTASGTGDANVPYAVLPNTGAARTGTMAIGGATVTVTQAAAPTGSISLTGAVSGLSGSCPALTFTVEGRVVRTSAATTFDTRCDRIRNGDNVTVNGTVQADNSVLALRVREN